METAQWVLLGIGGALLIFGLVLLVFGIKGKGKLEAITGTPTVRVADANNMAQSGNTQRVEVKGVAETTEDLIAPSSKNRCVYYRHLVEELRRQSRTKSDGTTHYDESWRTVSDSKRHVVFTVSDGTGSITVFPDKAEFISAQTLDKLFGAPSAETTDADGVLGTIGKAVDVLNRSGLGTSYRTSEWIIPTGRELYILGNITYQGNAAAIKKGDGPLIISVKSEEELTKKYKRSYILQFVFGAISAAGGLGCAIYSLIM